MQTTETEGICVLALIAYLERNDFTRIEQISHHVFHAKDGSRRVHIWAELVDGPVSDWVTVPDEFLRIAKEAGARPDAVVMSVDGHRLNLRHIMNAVVA